MAPPESGLGIRKKIEKNRWRPKGIDVKDGVADPRPARQRQGKLIWKRLSPLRYWPTFKNFTRNPSLVSRDVNVFAFWDMDNCPVKKEYDIKSLRRRIQRALKTVRKEFFLRKLVCVGDLAMRLEPEQVQALEKFATVEDQPKIDRRSNALINFDRDKGIAEDFLLRNPSVMGSSRLNDRIRNDLEDHHVAKYFLSKFFESFQPTELAQINKQPVVSPSQHLANFHIAKTNTAKGVPQPPIVPSQLATGYGLNKNPIISKTDLGDMKLLEAITTHVADYGPPGVILLISSDKDFASPLRKLKKRGYTILSASQSPNKHSLLGRQTHAGWTWDNLRDGFGYDYINDDVSDSLNDYFYESD